MSDTRDDADETDAVDDDVPEVVDTEVDDDVPDDAEDDAETEVEETPRTPRGDAPVRVRELVLLAVAVLGIAATVLFGLRWKDLHDTEVERQDVETSASEFLNAMFEWDGATIDADFDRILGFATGEFEQEARATFADDATREDLAANQASERADGVDVFVQSIEGDDARVFGVVQVRAVNATLPTPRADTVRVEVGMTKVDGEWKVYDFNVFDGLSLGLPVDTPADATTGTTVPEDTEG